MIKKIKYVLIQNKEQEALMIKYNELEQGSKLRQK